MLAKQAAGVSAVRPLSDRSKCRPALSVGLTKGGSAFGVVSFTPCAALSASTTTTDQGKADESIWGRVDE
jgi:hypothetical protein